MREREGEVGEALSLLSHVRERKKSGSLGELEQGRGRQ